MLALHILIILLATSSAIITIPLKKVYKEELKIKDELKIANSTNLKMTQLLSTSFIRNYMNMQYSAQLYVGSPAQLFSVQVGSGSAFLWIPSQKCKASCHESSNYFDSSRSSSYGYINSNSQITYGANYVKGDLSTESFSIGDKEVKSIKGQTFLLVHEDSGFAYADYDGILGLEYGSSMFGYPTFLDNLKIQGQISQKMFSVYLGNNNFEGNIYDGSNIIFGGYDLQYAQSPDIKYVNLNLDNGRWQIKLSNIKVSYSLISSKSYQAFFDVGTSLMRAPLTELNNIINKIASYGDCWIEGNFMVCDCGNYYTMDNYPSISFMLGSHTFSLNSKDYFLKSDAYCIFLFQINGYSDEWVFGDVFFRKYYTIFDADNSKMGFTPAKINYKAASIDLLTADLNKEDKIEKIKRHTEEQKSLIEVPESSNSIYFWVVLGILFAGLLRFIFNLNKTKKIDDEEIHYQKIYA